MSIRNSILADPQHPHVGLDLALAVEQGGVAAFARRERLDVVGQLTLQELRGLAAADHEARPAGAIDQPGLLTQGAVLGVELESRFHGSRL